MSGGCQLMAWHNATPFCTVRTLSVNTCRFRGYILGIIPCLFGDLKLKSWHRIIVKCYFRKMQFCAILSVSYRSWYYWRHYCRCLVDAILFSSLLFCRCRYGSPLLTFPYPRLSSHGNNITYHLSLPPASFIVITIIIIITIVMNISISISILTITIINGIMLSLLMIS